MGGCTQACKTVVVIKSVIAVYVPSTSPLDHNCDRIIHSFIHSVAYTPIFYLFQCSSDLGLLHPWERHYQPLLLITGLHLSDRHDIRWQGSR